MRQPSSRLGRSQVIALVGDAASTPSTTFLPQTYQVRVTSTLAGWLKIGDGAQTATGSDVFIPANAAPEYFTVSPGQQAAFLSTSTSTGCCSIGEMT